MGVIHRMVDPEGYKIDNISIHSPNCIYSLFATTSYGGWGGWRNLVLYPVLAELEMTESHSALTQAGEF